MADGSALDVTDTHTHTQIDTLTTVTLCACTLRVNWSEPERAPPEEVGCASSIVRLSCDCCQGDIMRALIACSQRWEGMVNLCGDCGKEETDHMFIQLAELGNTPCI